MPEQKSALSKLLAPVSRQFSRDFRLSLMQMGCRPSKRKRRKSPKRGADRRHGSTPVSLKSCRWQLFSSEVRRSCASSTGAFACKSTSACQRTTVFRMRKQWFFRVLWKKVAETAKKRSCSNSNLPAFLDSWQHI